MIKLIELDKVHKSGVILVIMISLISIFLLIHLEVQAFYPVLLLWLLIPIFFKKVIDRIKNYKGDS